MKSKIINTSNEHWQKATKTGQLWVRTVESVVLPEVLTSFAVLTLEGTQPLRPGTLLCKGAKGELWCQDKQTVAAKYDMTTTEADEWFLVTPKAANYVEFFFSSQSGFVQGQWGASVPGVGTNLQEVSEGDAVCRNPQYHADQWVVRRKIFDDTYRRG